MRGKKEEGVRIDQVGARVRVFQPPESAEDALEGAGLVTQDGEFALGAVSTRAMAVAVTFKPVGAKLEFSCIANDLSAGCSRRSAVGAFALELALSAFISCAIRALLGALVLKLCALDTFELGVGASVRLGALLELLRAVHCTNEGDRRLWSDGTSGAALGSRRRTGRRVLRRFVY